MSGTEAKVSTHYTHGNLLEAVQAGLKALKAGTPAEIIEVLAAIDEFHMGGRVATTALVEAMDLNSESHVLDIGCGLGGTARYITSAHGAQVTGVDLTEEYIKTGSALNEALGLAGQITLQTASATDMPFPPESFTHAAMLHVGMNIEDKPAVFHHAYRALRPGGCFAIYDVMQLNSGSVQYPVAWAENEDTSFLATPEKYTDLLQAAGFGVDPPVSKADLALTFFERIKTRIQTEGPPPLGLHILMGTNAKDKLGNMHANVQSGAIAPVQIIARKT